ncbi:UNVERIFIED_CONTAM: Homeobox-DDT domain protein RLT1 [Sesamum radiatum]|uniref:Homeobox-DDT domain protein RLT1 n=1 Tax=Sesamum radiatum TaxID=300843 RepID=A0AAW2UNU5_SESRA
MEEDSPEMHSEDEKGLLEKNKKRIVKTRPQVQALEKFYNEHKYPTESMKIQLAESVGLTEKQVSGWFCHRRLKDKKLMNGENYATGRQDRSSGVVQDRGSGHRQDSCGSTKQGDDRNLDNREVESGRLTPKEFSAADLTYEHGNHYAGNYNRVNDASSGSSSSLRNISNHQNGDPFDAASSKYLIPKFPTDVKGGKARSGPSGYLKVKGQVENAAITAVKRQLGKHYREDGPPLGVEFDPLPPGAFESSMQDPVQETCYTGDAVPATSPDVSKIRQNPKFGEQKFRLKNSLSNGGGAYYNNSSVELPEGSDGDVPGSESRDEYRLKPRKSVEAMRIDHVSSHPRPQPYGGKMREEPAERSCRKPIDVGTKVSLGENIENDYSNLIRKGNHHHNYRATGISRQIIKDGKMHPDRRTINENRVKVPFKNAAPKRLREDYPQQQHLKTSSMVDNLPETYQVIRPATEMPSSFSEDEESAETSSSVD